MEKDLKHYGVLGMKWGIRRNRRIASAHRSDERFFRSVGLNKIADVHGGMAAKREARAKSLKTQLSAAQKANMKKWMAKKSENRNKTKALIEDLLDHDRNLTTKRGKKWDEKGNRKFWTDLFESDLRSNTAYQREYKHKEKVNNIIHEVLIYPFA